jgi:hypothetical protein
VGAFAVVVELLCGASGGDAEAGLGEVQGAAVVAMVVGVPAGVTPFVGVDGGLGAAAATRVGALAVVVDGVF